MNLGLFLSKTYFPSHSENLMSSEGDLKAARSRFNKAPSNLLFLLNKRYSWMNKYLRDKKEIYELGCGAGFSSKFIENKNLCLTDITKFEWVDMYVDALNLPFSNNSVDVFICSHMIHHVAHPLNFLKKAIACLKPGGLIVISEINCSIFLRIILSIMRHEGWSYKFEIHSNSVANNPSDPWSANCAIPQMLFKDSYAFEKTFNNAKIIHNKLTEFLIFPLSGGVIATTKTINLPKKILRIIDLFDKLLIKLFPSIFPLGMEVVIQKRE